MRTNYQKAIRETLQQLADLEKNLRRKPTAARIRMLRLLKSGQAESLQTCAPLVGYSRIQLTRWWKQYKDEGIRAMTNYKPRSGKRSQLTVEAFNDLKDQMRQGHIARLEDARQHLAKHYGIHYKSLNGVWWMMSKQRVKLKTGRRKNRLADAAQQQEFKKTSVIS
jgi:transposase